MNRMRSFLVAVIFVAACTAIPAQAVAIETYQEVLSYDVSESGLSYWKVRLKCGNGVVDVNIGEQCDPAGDVSHWNCGLYDGCDSRCRCAHDPNEMPQFCGNGIWEAIAPVNEECDKAFDPSVTTGQCDDKYPGYALYTCKDNCTCGYCGDDRLDTDAGEECGEKHAPPCPDGSICVDCRCLPSCGEYGWDRLAGEECDTPVSGDPSIAEQCKITDGLSSLPIDATCDSDCRCHYCGDGIVEGNESCDPGMPLPQQDPSCGPSGGWCNASCKCEYCTDGYLQTANGEQCDVYASDCPDDPRGPSKGCDLTTCLCIYPECGDGEIDTVAGEECEGADTSTCGLDGMQRPAQSCQNCKCVYGECGDGSKEGLEECDVLGCMNTPKLDTSCTDGDPTTEDYCHSCKCTHTDKCGDGIIDATIGEECDPVGSATCAGGETCLAGCVCPKCGDGSLNTSGEECDDPATMDSDCAANSGYTLGDSGLHCVNCACEWCGDGAVNGSEQCDGGPSAACPWGCEADCTCTPPRCGDDRVNQPTEECDGPNDVATECANGSGYVLGEPGLNCVNCACEWCGDGTKNGSEDCDTNDMGACQNGCDMTNCTCAPPPPPTCGDGSVNATGEECDPGLPLPKPLTSCGAVLGYCNTSCKCEKCGDGTVQTWNGEQCDGLQVALCQPNSTCDGNCQCVPPPPPVCGDGHLDSGEDCDPPDMGTCQHGCDAATCTCKPAPVCGDGAVNAAGEECDDPATMDSDCAANNSGYASGDPGLNCVACKCEWCGDGTVNGSEPCDGGPNAACPYGCLGNCTCQPPQSAGPTCGDGSVNASGEECDSPDMGNCQYGCDAMTCTCKMPPPVCGDQKRDPGEECGDPDSTGNSSCVDPTMTCVACKCVPPTTGVVPKCGNDVLESGEECDADPNDANFAQLMKEQCGDEKSWCVDCACIDPDPACPPESCCAPDCEEEEQPVTAKAGVANCIVEWSGGATPESIRKLVRLNKRFNDEALKGSPLYGSVNPIAEAEFSTVKLTVFLPNTAAEGARPRAINVGGVSMGPWMVVAKGGKMNDFWVKKYRPGLPETTNWVRVAPLMASDFTASEKSIPTRAIQHTLSRIVVPELSADAMNSLGLSTDVPLQSILSLGGEAQVVSDTLVKFNNVAIIEVKPAASTSKAAGSQTFGSIGSITTTVQPIVAGFTAVEGYGGATAMTFDTKKLIEAVKSNVDARKAAGQQVDCSVLLVSDSVWPAYQNYQVKFIQELDTVTEQSGAWYGTNLAQVKGSGFGLCSLNAFAPYTPHALTVIGLVVGTIGGIIAVRRRRR